MEKKNSLREKSPTQSGPRGTQGLPGMQPTSQKPLLCLGHNATCIMTFWHKKHGTTGPSQDHNLFHVEPTRWAAPGSTMILLCPQHPHRPHVSCAPLDEEDSTVTSSQKPDPSTDVSYAKYQRVFSNERISCQGSDLPSLPDTGLWNSNGAGQGERQKVGVCEKPGKVYLWWGWGEATGPLFLQ